MQLQPDQIQEFYETSYEPGVDGEKYGRWRELGARGKADHIVDLAGRVGCGRAERVLEVGCGEGAVLAELARRDFGRVHHGLEISGSAVRLAARRPELAEVTQFDGAVLPVADDSYDVAYATHVLEHVQSPQSLVREMMRVARVVIVEVPLEANLSARRPAGRKASEAAGHLQRFDRSQVRRLITGAGWQVRAELLDPLPAAVHLFGKDRTAERIKGWLKWAVRRASAAAPTVGTRLFTFHFALAATTDLSRDGR